MKERRQARNEIEDSLRAGARKLSDILYFSFLPFQKYICMAKAFRLLPDIQISSWLIDYENFWLL